MITELARRRFCLSQFPSLADFDCRIVSLSRSLLSDRIGEIQFANNFETADVGGGVERHVVDAVSGDNVEKHHSLTLTVRQLRLNSCFLEPPVVVVLCFKALLALLD